MCAQTKTKRILTTKQHIILDQTLDDLAEKKYSAPEFLAAFKPKLEKLHSLGYTPKQLAEIVSEKTGEAFSQAEIKRVLGERPAKKTKTKKNPEDNLKSPPRVHSQEEKRPSAKPTIPQSHK